MPPTADTRRPSPVWTLLAALLAAAGPIASAPASRGIAEDSAADLACCASAAALESLADRAAAFDESTGRSLLNYPPHRHADHVHMKLELWIGDMNVPRAEARQTLTVRPIARELSRLDLDAQLLTIHGVASEGHQVQFEHDGATLRLTFSPPLPPDATAEIVTRYSIEDPPRGLNWTLESPAWPGRAAQIHTQGQTDTNSYWFPCHNAPNERLTTELVVTVPGEYLVSSNGRFVSRTRADRAGVPGSRPDLSYETWHWLQDKPHAAYLVSLVVGQFAVKDLGSASLPMPVYAPPGRADDIAGTYGRTPEMVRYFARLFDEPYPWDRYAQLIVWNFGAGGMENTAATTMYDTAILDREARIDHDLDGLISHELAHQWFGDLITCKSWEHTWLNEGFATYCSQLWAEHRDGPDAYLAGIRGNFDSVIRADDGIAPDTPGMVSKEWRRPGDTFGRAANPYPKGSSILHMLRRRLGDELFFRGIALYVDRHRLGEVETNDLRRAFEEVSGDSLERFFQQWCYRPGVPRLDIGIDWDTSTSELIVSVVQSQTIDGYNPAFAFDLPIWVGDATDASVESDAGNWFTLPVETKEASIRIPLASEPAIVAVDPLLDVLAEMRINQVEARWVRQLRWGPTVPARIQAARALRAEASDAVGDALLFTAQNEVEHVRVRESAVESLGHRRDTDRLLTLASRMPENHHVRLELVQQVGTLAGQDETDPAWKDRIKPFLIDRATSDRSLRVRAAAVGAIGDMGAVDQIGLVLAAASQESQHDALRQAALRALARLDQPEGLSVAIQYAQPGAFNRTRPGAISAVVDLAHHDPDAAFHALAPLVSDRESRASSAAGRALVRLGDPRGLPVLEARLAACRDARDREQVQGWIDELREKVAAPQGPG